MKNRVYVKRQPSPGQEHLDHLKELATDYCNYSPSLEQIIEIIDRNSKEFVAKSKRAKFLKSIDNDITEIYQEHFKQWRDY